MIICYACKGFFHSINWWSSLFAISGHISNLIVPYGRLRTRWEGFHTPHHIQPEFWRSINPSEDTFQNEIGLRPDLVKFRDDIGWSTYVSWWLTQTNHLDCSALMKTAGNGYTFQPSAFALPTNRVTEHKARIMKTASDKISVRWVSQEIELHIRFIGVYLCPDEWNVLYHRVKTEAVHQLEPSKMAIIVNGPETIQAVSRPDRPKLLRDPDSRDLYPEPESFYVEPNPSPKKYRKMSNLLKKAAEKTSHWESSKAVSIKRLLPPQSFQHQRFKIIKSTNSDIDFSNTPNRLPDRVWKKIIT